MTTPTTPRPPPPKASPRPPKPPPPPASPMLEVSRSAPSSNRMSRPRPSRPCAAGRSAPPGPRTQDPAGDLPTERGGRRTGERAERGGAEHLGHRLARAAPPVIPVVTPVAVPLARCRLLRRPLRDGGRGSGGCRRQPRGQPLVGRLPVDRR